MVEIKIVRVLLNKDKDTEQAEQELARLRNAGWEFALGAGGTGRVAWQAAGFVILERPKPQ